MAYKFNRGVFKVGGTVNMADATAVTHKPASVDHGDLAEDVISGQAELAHADIQDADDLMIHDATAGAVLKVGVDSLRDHYFGAVSGDATIADGGALTIAAGAVETAMLADDAVDADKLAANAVVNASIASNAAIDMDKLDGGSLAASLSDLAQGDLLYAGDIDASNALKSITFSNFEDAIFGNVGGDATIAAGGSLTIAALAVENGMLAGSIANSKLANSAMTIGGASTSLGGTVTSATILAAGILNNVGAATSDYSLNSQKITNLGTPTADADAATKAYVDGVASGLDVKKSVRAASAANIAGTYNNGAGTITAGSNGALGAQDGITMGAGQRLLLKNQTDATQNGIYVVTNAGDGSNPYVLTRATDMDEVAEITPGLFTFVEEGSISQNQGFVLTTNKTGSIAIGTDDLDFAQFSGAGAITAGTGLGKSGNTISVNAAQTGINSILATDLVLGEDAQTKIDFGNPNEIQFRANNTVTMAVEQHKVQIMSGSFRKKVQTIGTSGALSNTANIEAHDGTMVLIHPDASKTFSLPAVSGMDGAVFMIKNASADGGNSLTLAVQSGEKLDGQANGTAVLEGQASISCVVAGAGSDASWWIF